MQAVFGHCYVAEYQKHKASGNGISQAADMIFVKSFTPEVFKKLSEAARNSRHFFPEYWIFRISIHIIGMILFSQYTLSWAWYPKIKKNAKSNVEFYPSRNNLH